MEIGDQLYLYRQQARHHTSDVARPILADISLDNVRRILCLMEERVKEA